MKKFLIKISAFAVVMLLLMVGLDRVITHNLHHSEARMFSGWNAAYHDTTVYDMWILGSSSAWWMIDPKVLDSICDVNSYNFGINGQSINAEILRYHVLRDQKPKPQYIIHTVDQGMFIPTQCEREQFLPYMSDSVIWNGIKSDFHYSWSERYIPLIRYAGYPELIYEGLKLPNALDKFSLYKGFQALDVPFDSTTIMAMEALYFGRNEDFEQRFENYIDEVSADGIQILLVMPPMHPLAVEKMGEQKAEMIAYFDSIAYRHNVVFLCYLDSVEYAKSAYYFNASHLNKTGVDVFAPKLAIDIKNIIKR